jgi:hypothetical protein
MVEEDLFTIEEQTAAEGEKSSSGTRPMSMMEISRLVHLSPGDRLDSTLDMASTRGWSPLAIMGVGVALVGVVIGFLWLANAEPEPTATEIPAQAKVELKSATAMAEIRDTSPAAVATDAGLAASTDSARPATSPPSRVISVDREATKVIRKPRRTNGRPKPKRTRKPRFDIK